MVAARGYEVKIGSASRKRKSCSAESLLLASQCYRNATTLRVSVLLRLCNNTNRSQASSSPSFVQQELFTQSIEQVNGPLSRWCSYADTDYILPRVANTFRLARRERGQTDCSSKTLTFKSLIWPPAFRQKNVSEWLWIGKIRSFHPNDHRCQIMNITTTGRPTCYSSKGPDFMASLLRIGWKSASRFVYLRGEKNVESAVTDFTFQCNLMAVLLSTHASR